MKSKQQIEIIPAKTFEIKPDHKYLIIMPINAELKYLDPVLKEFFGENKVLVLAAQDVSQIKITELLESK